MIRIEPRARAARRTAVALALSIAAAAPAALATRPANEPWTKQDSAPAPAADLDAKLAALDTELAATLDALWEKYDARFGKLKDADWTPERERELSEFQRDNDPTQGFARRYEELALAAAGTDVAVRCHGAIVGLVNRWNTTDTSASERALATLARDYFRSEAIAPIALGLSYEQRLPRTAVEQFLGTLRADSPHAGVRAAATYVLAFRAMRGDDKARARELFAALRDQYGQISSRRGTSYAEIAAANLFELERLQIGMVAPDFDAVDENGVAFKLSDYRGKVMVLDFWGAW